MGERGGGRGEKNHFRRSHVTRAGKSVALGQFIIARGGISLLSRPELEKKLPDFHAKGAKTFFVLLLFKEKFSAFKV